MTDYSKKERDGYMDGLEASWRKSGWVIVRTDDLKAVIEMFAFDNGDGYAMSCLDRLVKRLGYTHYREVKS